MKRWRVTNKTHSGISNCYIYKIKNNPFNKGYNDTVNIFYVDKGSEKVKAKMKLTVGYGMTASLLCLGREGERKN